MHVELRLDACIACRETASPLLYLLFWCYFLCLLRATWREAVVDGIDWTNNKFLGTCLVSPGLQGEKVAWCMAKVYGSRARSKGLISGIRAQQVCVDRREGRDKPPLRLGRLLVLYFSVILLYYWASDRLALSNLSVGVQSVDAR
jgi:hypothetical protein